MSKRQYVIPKTIYETRNPTAIDDQTIGMISGQPWINYQDYTYFICVNVDTNNAIWKQLDFNIEEGEYCVGKSMFLGNSYPRFIYHSLFNYPKFVSVFPIEMPEEGTSVGDIWVKLDDSKDYFEVYNTGDAKNIFCWFACYKETDYRELIIDREGPQNSGYVYTVPYVGIIDEFPANILFPYNTDVNIYAITNDGFEFVNWGGTDSIIDDNISTVCLNEDKIVIGTYKNIKHTLNVNVINSDHGSVKSTPVGISCGSTCSKQFTKNTQVTLSPIFVNPEDVIFDKWEGCDSTDQNNNGIVTMDKDRTVNAVFIPDLPKLLLTVHGEGQIQVDQSILCDSNYSEYFDWNQQVNITAIPDDNRSFIKWFGAIDFSDSDQTIIMDQDKTIGAIFSENLYIVSVNYNQNGIVDSNIEINNCNTKCEAVVESNENIQLESIPDEGYLFDKWIINGNEYFDNPLSIMVDQDLDINNNFIKEEYLVNVTVDENGSYDISNTNIKFGDTVIITPLPNQNYELDSCDGCDEIINNVCYIYDINEDKNIVLTFNLIQTQVGTGTDFGYVCGGYSSNTIQKFIFPFDFGQTQFSSNLIKPIQDSCANHSSTYAFICGGNYNTITFNKIQRFQFSLDTTTETIFELDENKDKACANNSTHFGYICSGFYQNQIIQKFMFPFDDGDIQLYGNLTEIYNGDGLNSEQYGYVVGSVDFSNNEFGEFTKFIDKFDFSLDTGTASKSLETSVSYITPSACNSSAFGYITSGVQYNNFSHNTITQIDEIDYNLDSGICSNYSSITNNNIRNCANNSTQFGYVCGGHTISNKIPTNTFSKINFSLISEIVDSQNIYLNEPKHSSSATDGTMFW